MSGVLDKVCVCVFVPLRLVDSLSWIVSKRIKKKISSESTKLTGDHRLPKNEEMKRFLLLS